MTVDHNFKVFEGFNHFNLLIVIKYEGIIWKKLRFIITSWYNVGFVQINSEEFVIKLSFI